MPHVILEFTEDSASPDQISPLLDSVHQAVIDSGLFRPSHIKSRAVPVAHYRTGTNQRPFIHVQLRIKPGRSPSQKQALTAAVVGAIRDQKLAACIITAEVVDLEADSYSKYEV